MLSSDVKILLTVLKGVVEHEDTTAYFGSLLAHSHYREKAAALGWIEPGTWRATAKGRALYDSSGVGALTPKTSGFRWMHWKGWDRVLDPFARSSRG